MAEGQGAGASGIRVTIDYYSIRVHIDGLLHVYVLRSKLLGISSWKDGGTYSLEFARAGGSILCEYDSAEKFRAVMGGLEGVL
jgi:hypothetical protein